MATNRAKILGYMKKRGFINKRIAAQYKWSFGLGNHIMKLREKHIIETSMISVRGSRFALYMYVGERSHD